MRISDWSSDVCSSDLHFYVAAPHRADREQSREEKEDQEGRSELDRNIGPRREAGGDPEGDSEQRHTGIELVGNRSRPDIADRRGDHRSEEHTSELQSLMRISYAVFFLKKKNKKT